MMRFQTGPLFSKQEISARAEIECPQILRERQSKNAAVMQQRLSAYLLLAELCGGRLPELIWEESGKPIFQNRREFCSISHTAAAAAAVCSDNPVGIDIQKIVCPSDALLKRVCTPQELLYCTGDDNASDRSRRFTAVWSAKEAIAKVSGAGLAALGLKNIHTDLPGRSGSAAGAAYQLRFVETGLPELVCCIADFQK